jgi:uncharacterized RDD family membrane protein YckC
MAAEDRDAGSGPLGGAAHTQDHLDPGTGEQPCDELTRRVQKFRRRRANLRGSFEAESTLEFDFGENSRIDMDTVPGPELVRPVRPGEEFEVVTRTPQARKEKPPPLESIPLRGMVDALPSQRSVDADLRTDEQQTEARRRRRPDPGDVSILMESLPEEETESTAPAAPLGRRFLAGLVDGLMLLLALVFFVAIFWWVMAGSLQLRLVHLGALSVVVGFLVLFYFTLFGRMASATPGQQAAGLMLRSLDGCTPTSAQALWRAFGYLVSLSALMLGFVWALVDSEGLTWHDRMSGTFLANREPR